MCTLKLCMVEFHLLVSILREHHVKFEIIPQNVDVPQNCLLKKDRKKS